MRLRTRYHGDTFGTYEAYAFDEEKREIVAWAGRNDVKSDWFFSRSAALTALKKKLKSITKK